MSPDTPRRDAMPAHFDLSWEPRGRRWWKMYKGRRFVISCRQLGVPGTKEESYQAANEWWRRKRAEIDGQPAPSPYSNFDRLMAMATIIDEYQDKPLPEL
jgi:hypothetical protein